LLSLRASFNKHTIAAVLFYFTLSFGSFLPIHESAVTNLAVGILLFSLIVYVLTMNRVSSDVAFLVSFFLITFFLLAQMLRTDAPIYALSKIDGYVFSTFALLYLYKSSTGKYEFNELFFKYYLKVSFCVLLATVFYKVNFGFWERDVRFLFNGSIIFGWLMALSAILCLSFSENENKNEKFKYIFLFFVFSLSVVWTESKGALICLLVGCLVFGLLSKNIFFKISAVIMIISIFSVLIFPDFFLELTRDTRYASVFRFIVGEQLESDWGSIGVRQEMIDHAWGQILNSYWLGIGLGNFSFYEFFYPHNQHIEILLELGIFYFMFHFFTLSIGLLTANRLYKTLIIAFVVAASFSGDLPYMRFVYFFTLSSIFCYVYEKSKSC